MDYFDPRKLPRRRKEYGPFLELFPKTWVLDGIETLKEYFRRKLKKLQEEEEIQELNRSPHYYANRWPKEIKERAKIALERAPNPYSDYTNSSIPQI